MKETLGVLVVDSSQQLRKQNQHIETEDDIVFVYQTDTRVEAVRSSTLSREYDVTVYYAGQNTVDSAMFQKIPIPVIVLLDNPTVDLTVDLMNAGAMGVVERQNTQRLVELIRRSQNEASPFCCNAIYQDIIDSQTELICRYDADLRLRYVNRAYSDWYGSSSDDLIGKSFIDVIPVEERERALNHVRSLTLERPIATSIHRAVLTGGTVRTVEWTDRAIFDADNNLIEYQGVGRDVTERENQGQKLEIYRNHLNDILNTMQDGLISLSLPDRQTIFASHVFEEIFGYPATKFKDDPQFFKQVVHPDDLEKALEAQQRCLREGFVELEHRIIRPDGEVRWVHRRAWVNYDENGQPIRVNDIARDITQQKADQQLIKERGTNLQTLFDTIGDFLFVLDENAQIIEVNRQVIDVLGYSQDELVGQSVLYLHPPDLHEEAQQIIGDILAGKRQTCPLSIQKKNGDLIPVETRATWGEWNGKPAIFGLSKDISELKMSEERFELVFRTNPAIAGLSSLKTGEYVEVNRAFCEKLGFTRDEVIGAKATELLKLDPQWREVTLQKLQKQGYIYAEETVILKRDGTPLPVLLSAEVVTLHGEKYNFTTAVDISKRKKVEHDLQESEEKYRSLVESSDAIIVMLNEAGDLLFVNQVAATQLGMDVQALTGKNMYDLFPADIADENMKLAREVIHSGQGVDYEALMPVAGVNRWYRVSIQPVKSPSGDIKSVLIYADDITERKQDQQQLELQGLALEHLLNGFDIVGDDGLFIYANQAYLDMWGYDHVDEIIGTSPIGHCADPTIPQQLIENVVQKGEYTLEFVAKRKDGSTFDVLMSVQSYTMSNGHTIFFGSSTDITERKKAENQLEESRRRLRLFVEHAPAAIAMFDKNMNYLLVSQRWSQDYQLQETDVVGRSHYDVFPDIPDRWKEIHRRCLNGEVASSAADPFPRMDGRVDWVRWEIRPWYDSQGTIGGIFLFSEVITERQEMANALQESEARYRGLVESSEAAIMQVDANGDFLFANEIAAGQLGLELDNMIGKNMHDLFPSDEATARLSTIRDVIATGQGIVMEAQSQITGELRWYRSSVQPIRTGTGNVTSVLLYASDITDFKSAEMALRNSQKQFQQFMNHLPGSVFIKDAQGNTVYANERFHAQRNTTREQISNDDPSDHNTPEMTEALREENEQILRDGRAMEFHHTLPVADGLMHLLTIKFPIPIEGKSALIGGISLDVTREKQAEVAIKNSELRYRQMFERVRLPKLITNLETMQILDANPAAAEYYGYSIETLKTMKMIDIIVTEPELLAEKVQEVLVGEGNVCEFEHRLADGSIREVEGYPSMIEHAGQQALYCTYIDVTERNRAQAALEDVNQFLEQQVKERTSDLELSKDRIEAIFNHSADAILLLDTELRIRQANYAFDRMFDISHESYFGTPLIEFVSDEYREALEAYLPAIVIWHETKRMELKVMHADGTVFDVEISIAPVNRSDQTVENLVCIIRDISERKRVEAERKHYVDEIEDLYNNAPAGYHSLDQSGTIVQINDTELAWLGYTREEIIGKRKFIDFLTPKSRGIFQRNFPLFLKRGWIKDLEFEVYKKDGSTFFVIVNASAIMDENGNILQSRSHMIDITELKEAQKAVNEERNLLRTVIDAVPDFIYVKDTEHRMIMNNIAHARSVGFIPENMVGKSDFDLFPHEIAVKFNADEKKLFETRQALVNIEERLLDNSGKEMWTLTTKVPLYGIDGKLTGLVGITHNVTEMKSHEALLRASEDRLRTIVENIPVMISFFDADGRFEFVNKNWLDQVGWTVEDLSTAEDPLALFYPDPDYRQQVLDFMLSAEPGWRDFNSQTKHRGERITSWANVRLSDGRGIGIGQDITERKLAEGEIRLMSERLQLATESGEIGVWDWKPQTNELLWDEQMYRLYGIDNRHCTESVEIWNNALYPDDAARAQAELEAALQGKKRFNTEFRIVTPEGDIRHIQAHANTYRHEDGTPYRMVGVNVDITGQKIGELALKKALEKEKELNKLKSIFVSTASHQFRTPLAAILAATETLSRLRDRLTEAQIDARLHRIQTQVNRMKVLMDDVLELSRMQSEQIQFKPEQSDLDALCRETIEDFAHQSGYDERIVYHGPTAPLIANLDPHLMHHIINNLLHNALKYSDDLVYVELKLANREIIFKVKDHGIGIPEDDIKNLFVPFVRAKNVVSVEGTGLGLSIVEQAVEAHNGTIEVNSTVDVGTVFTVRLPYISNSHSA